MTGTRGAPGRDAYRASGVDVAAGERAVDLMRSAVESTHRREVVGLPDDREGAETGERALADADDRVAPRRQARARGCGNLHAVITCHLRYEIDPDQIEAFERFARRWMELVERHGGTHHGYFLPSERRTDEHTSELQSLLPISYGDLGV